MRTDEVRVGSHRDLRVWRHAVELAVECYRLAGRFPPNEAFGLSAQLKRAAVSVPANIAEGHGRRSRGDYARFLRIAHASLMEVDTHVELAHRLAFVAPADAARVLRLRDDVGRMLGGLMRRVQAAPPR